jgi:hypothetical protein
MKRLDIESPETRSGSTGDFACLTVVPRPHNAELRSHSSRVSRRLKTLPSEGTS